MAKSFGCKCEERKKKPEDRNWVIYHQYRCNHSRFSGGHKTRSDYSTILCNSCGEIGRSKGDFVEYLYNAKKVVDLQ